MRWGVLVIVAAALGLSGVAGAAVISRSGDEPTPPTDVDLVAEQVAQDAGVADEHEASDGPEAENDDEGVHGGPIERFHGPAVCDLVDVSSLPGNWTHGDYVRTLEALGQPELVPIAARSACGKPAHAGGPPEHAGPPNHAGPPDHAGGPPEHAGPPDHAGAPDDAGPPESS